MSGLEPLGKLMVLLGATLAVLGGLVWLLSKTAFLGRLPGDIRLETDGFSCLIPVVSSLVLSIILTIVLNVLIRLINR